MIVLIDRLSFELPAGWRQHSGEAGEHQKTIAIHTPRGSAHVHVETADPRQAMPAGQDTAVVAAIHSQSIDDDSGLIEVKTTSGAAIRAVHAVFKRRIDDPASPTARVRYLASLYTYLPGGSIYVFQFDGQEEGVTGTREAQVLTQAQARGDITFARDSHTGQLGMRGWSQDPYDPSFAKGFLMNQSESAEYDSLFPEHPLSLVRAALAAITRTLQEHPPDVATTQVGEG